MLLAPAALLQPQSGSRRALKTGPKKGLEVLDSGRCQWTPLDRRLEGKSCSDNGLQRFLDVRGFPWIGAVERVMGIEPARYKLLN